jgi:hypothetical protein
MSNALNQSLLEALLDSSDRNNAILVNLLRAVPEGGLAVRAMEGSPSLSCSYTSTMCDLCLFWRTRRNLPESCSRKSGPVG